MTERVWDPSYWKERLDDATLRGQPHLAVFRCARERWKQIEERHRGILARTIGNHDAVIDCGCGWGRLLDLLPPRTTWSGPYMGVDISPDFIMKALTGTNRRMEGNAFICCKLEELSSYVPLLKAGWTRRGCEKCRGTGEPGWDCGPAEGDGQKCQTCNGTGTIDILSSRRWDWAIMVSVRPMVIRNQGQEAWDVMEREIRKVAERLLYLEYDPLDEGSVE